MKGKMLAGIVLWVIGAIYVFLVYPLLQNKNTPEVIVDTVILSWAKDLSDYKNSSAVPQNDDIETSSQKLEANKICFQSTCFTIEIADTFASRQQGLMHRDSLPQDAGMLFVFDMPGSYGFWMKNTLIPLDIIRLDQNFVVIDTATMTPCITDPCPSYNHSGLATYALEINAWLVAQYNIHIWDVFTQQ